MRSFYSYIGDAWSSPREGYVGALRQDRLKAWRQESTVQKIERPTRLDRARALGYKAKQGIIVARVKVRRGGRRKSRYERNRKTSKMGVNTITMAKSIQRIAEERAGRRYRNMEVLNSYWVAEDGKQKFYEVILVDPPLHLHQERQGPLLGRRQRPPGQSGAWQDQRWPQGQGPEAQGLWH
jgi:LSU ribosomal protein L15E